MALSEEARKELAKARQNANMWGDYKGSGWNIGSSNQRLAEEDARREAAAKERLYQQYLAAKQPQERAYAPSMQRPAVANNVPVSADYAYDDYGTMQRGDFDPVWNGDFFNSRIAPVPLPEKYTGAGTTPLVNYQFDDSYGRGIRDNYQPREEAPAPEPRRKGSEGDMPTWPGYKDIFPDW